jgi:hypothetical protein
MLLTWTARRMLTGREDAANKNLTKDAVLEKTEAYLDPPGQR